MPSETAITLTLDLLNKHNPCKIAATLSPDSYAAEAYSFAALHEHHHLTPARAAAVLRFWHPHINITKIETLPTLLDEITQHLDELTRNQT